MTAPIPPVDMSGIQNALNDLGSSMQAMATNIQNINVSGKLEDKIQSIMSGLSQLPSKFQADASALTTQLKALSGQVAQNAADLKSAYAAQQTAIASGDKSGIAKAGEAIQGFIANEAELGIRFNELSSEAAGLTNDFKKVSAENQKLLKSMNQTVGGMIAMKLAGGDEGKADVLKLLGSKIAAVFSEIGKIAQEGIRKATDLGLSATEGVGLEFSNRVAQFTSLFTFDPAKMVSPEKMNAMQSAAMGTFVNLAEGTQLSSEGMKKLQQDLQKGFNSEFQVTGESLRALATVGATSAEGFEQFRVASGRASLSSGQFASIVSKNSLSFLLYGNSFAKAAADADRLGISLSSVQKGQESYVTNLDGAIDTIAQLNQLGGRVDFGTLTQLAEFGTPDQVAAYIRSTIPTSMLNSASVRALVGGLMPGIDAETLLKMAKTGQSLDELQKGVTKNSTGTQAQTDAVAALVKGTNILTGSFGGLILASIAAATSLFAVSKAGGIAAFMTGTGIAALGKSLLSFSVFMGTLLLPLAAIVGGFALLSSASSAASKPAGAVRGAGGGAGIGFGLTLAAAMLGAPFTGGTSLALVAGSALIGAGVGAYKADDMISGYGDRTLVTPTGAIALNNQDTVIAGTNLFQKGQLQAGGDNSELTKKLDTLISSLTNAKTTINVDGVEQKVNSMGLSKVNITRQGVST